MKYLYLALLSSCMLFSCLIDNDKENSNPQNIDDFITIEATAVFDTTNTAIPAWYNDTYLPKMMTYSGLKGVRRLNTLKAVPKSVSSVEFLPAYLTLFMSSSKEELMGLSESTQAREANAAMAAQWSANQIERTWDVSYEKLKSWENESAKNSLVYVKIVPTVAAEGYDLAVNDWEINTHVPWLMKYKGLSKVVRYKRIDNTGMNVTEMPEYIELFYYADKEGYEGQKTDENFIAAEEDRANTWLNGELDVPWSYSGQIVKEIIK